MIEVIKQQFTNDMTAEEKLNRTREFLQIVALKILYDKNLLKNLAFTGGTALRILFNLKRFSEDIDFSLVDKKGYNFDIINSELVRGFKLYGLDMEIKVKDEGNVHSVFLKFKGLLNSLGLSALEEQKLSIKIEVDTNPPKGWELKNTIVNKIFMFGVIHFDLSSLFATKLHACFYRKYIKGRDFYDFIWYITKKIESNYVVLNNAIKQTHGENPGIDKANFMDFLLSNIEHIDFNIVKKDVERFLEDKSELRLFEVESIKSIIKQVY